MIREIAGGIGQPAHLLRSLNRRRFTLDSSSLTDSRPEQRRLPDLQRLPVGQGQDLLHERLEDRQPQVQDHRGALQGDLGVAGADRGHRQGRQDHRLV